MRIVLAALALLLIASLAALLLRRRRRQRARAVTLGDDADFEPMFPDAPGQQHGRSTVMGRRITRR